VRIRKASLEGQISAISNLEDNVRKNHSVDWLPQYDEFRAELISAWRLMEGRRNEAGKSQKGGHPSLPILPGHEQPGPHQRKCYGCGNLGHIRGDPSCSAGPNGIWDGAPQVWKDRVKKADGKGKSNGSSKGKNGVQRNKGKRDQGGVAPKGPCHNWSRGNGFCKYADACRYSHDGPKEDQCDKGNKANPNKRRSDNVFLATKKGKRARKHLTSLILKDLKEEGTTSAKNKSKDSDDSDHLYNLIRGVPTVVIRARDSFDDYIPRRGFEIVEEEPDELSSVEDEKSVAVMRDDNEESLEQVTLGCDTQITLPNKSAQDDEDDRFWNDLAKFKGDDLDVQSFVNSDLKHQKLARRNTRRDEKTVNFTVTLVMTDGNSEDGDNKAVDDFQPQRPVLRNTPDENIVKLKILITVELFLTIKISILPKIKLILKNFPPMKFKNGKIGRKGQNVL
jgi:hypothetical protein